MYDDVKGGEEKRLVQEAQAELYRRHRGFLYGVIDRSPLSDALRRVEGDGAIKSHVCDTFRRAFNRADTFDASKGKIRAWLSRVAENLLKSKLRPEEKKKEMLERVDMDLSEVAERKDGDSESESEEVAAIREAMEEVLSDRQREILTAYLTTQVGGRAEKGDVAELAASLETTPEYLRQVKYRAKQAVKGYLEEHYPDLFDD